MEKLQQLQQKQLDSLFLLLKAKHEQYSITLEEATDKALVLSYLSLVGCMSGSDIFDERMVKDVVKFTDHWKSHMEEKTGRNLDKLLGKHFKGKNEED